MEPFGNKVSEKSASFRDPYTAISIFSSELLYHEFSVFTIVLYLYLTLL